MLSKGLIGAGIVAVGLMVFFGAKWLTASFIGGSHDTASHRSSVAGIEEPAVPLPPDWPAPREDSKRKGSSGTKTEDRGSTEIQPAPVELPEQSGTPPVEEEPPPTEEKGGGGGSTSGGGDSGNGWVTTGKAGG